MASRWVRAAALAAALVAARFKTGRTPARVKLALLPHALPHSTKGHETLTFRGVARPAPVMRQDQGMEKAPQTLCMSIGYRPLSWAPEPPMCL
eukprot:637836-Prymnesium_polylepis.1